MATLTDVTTKFDRHEAIRKMSRASAERGIEPLPEPKPNMREPDKRFESPLSEQEVDKGVRDGTFTQPRDLRPGGGTGRYLTKDSQRGPGDDDGDDADPADA